MESLGTDSPHRLGRYVLGVRLAVGGMAEVWLARQDGPANFTKQLVVKKILPQYAADEAFVEMFLNEARLAALLNHSNVVQIFELGEEAGAYYLVMEFIHGRNLRVMHKRAMQLGMELPFAASAFMVAGACEGLHHAHQLRDGSGKPMELVHRDVSPDNILVSFDGQPKVVDFGIAKAFNVSSFTQPGTLKGKFAYMSPEQALGKQLDRRADVYSVGVVLYELLSGKKPFRGESQLELMRMVLEEPPVPLSEVRPDVPQPLVEVVNRALAKKKEDRYPDARSMARDLEAYLRTTSFGGIGDVAALMDKLFGHERDQLRQMGLALTPKPDTVPAAQLRQQLRPDLEAGRGDKTEIGPSPFGDAREGPPPPPKETAVGPVPVRPPQASNPTLPSQGSIPTQPLPQSPPQPLIVPRRGLGAPAIAAVAMIALVSGAGIVFALGGDEAAPSGDGVTAQLRREPAAESPAVPPQVSTNTGAVARVPALGAAPVVETAAAIESPTAGAAPAAETASRVGAGEPAAPAPMETMDRSPPSTPSTSAASDAVAKSRERARPPRPRRPAAPGKLLVRVNPWAEVSVDGKVVGVTPLPAISAEPGRRTVKLTNSDLGRSKTIVVDVKPGRESVLKVDLLE